MTINELYKGKATIIKGVTYNTTQFYCEPFIKKIQPLCKNIIITVKEADQVSFTEGQPDIIYNRVLIQGVLKESSVKGYSNTINMTYALDIKNPVCKIYTAFMNDFGDIIQTDKECIIFQNMTNSALNYSNIDALLERESVLETVLKQMEQIEFTKNEILSLIGNWVDFTLKNIFVNDYVKVKLSKTTAVEVYQMFTDKNSEFYIDDKLNKSTCFFAFAKIITDDKKDFIHKFEKTILISKMFNL